MKGQSAMRIPAFIAVLSVMIPIASLSQVTGVVQRAEALQAKLERFASIPGSDVIEPGETNAVSYVDECNDFFCAYIDSMGWTTNLAVESLVVVVSNLVGSVHSNRFLQACTAEVAINCLARHANAAQIQAVEPLLVNCDRDIAYSLSECVVDFRGLSHSAFSRYNQISDGFGHSSDNSGVLCGTIARKMKSGSYSPAVTNRYIWFSLNALQKDPWGSLFNTMLIDCWPGYATSSNRLASVNQCFAEGGCSDIISNEVIKVRNELLALPPGTMQMLSTNQFYNVED